LQALLDDSSLSIVVGSQVCDAAYESMLLLLQKAAEDPPLLEE